MIEPQDTSLTSAPSARLLSGLALLTAVFAASLSAQHIDIVVHDPSMIKQDDTYYLFNTGRGIAVWSSEDRVNWERLDSVFSAPPVWTHDVVPDFRNHIWAPSIWHHDGTYYLYYSVSSFGRNNSAIGLATNQTLHPDDPEFEWVDQGIVVESVPGRDMWNAIDATLAFDDNGAPWLTFGSHWLGIKLVRLEDDLKTIAMTPEGNEWHTIARRHRYWKLHERDAGDSENPELDYDELYPTQIFNMNRRSENSAIEAPFIFKKGDYYYLFVSWDRCCRGENSTYKVVVGRSPTITGPYLDRTDQNLNHGGGTLVVKGNENYAGIGHNSVYTFDDTDYLVAHGYDLSDNGRSKLIIAELEWDHDGWPFVRLARETEE